MRLPRDLIFGIALVAAGATAVISAVPAVRFAYSAPSLHIALETAAALIAFLAAYLVYGRFRESCRLDDLVLVAGLVLLAASNLVFSAVPAAASELERFTTWAPLIGRILAAIVITVAAYIPPERVGAQRSASLLTAVALLVALTLIAVPTVLFESRLPSGIDPTLSPDVAGSPRIEGHAIIPALQLLAMFLYVVAALGFLRRGERRGDELMYWLAAGAVLAAASKFNYFLYPSLFSRWVYTGDGFRLLFYLVLLIGASREIGRLWRDRAAGAVLEERRRMARDLHDGVAQELAFISRRARRLAARPDDATAGQIAAAAERALDDSRRAIAALTRPIDEPLEVTLAQAAEEVAARVGVSVTLDLEQGIQVSSAEREALVRIASEAISNAGRHSGASSIRVELSNRDRVRLRIVDDGIGFDPTRAETRANGGFGLISMQERTSSVGAEFTLTSREGVGTEVEVALP